MAMGEEVEKEVEKITDSNHSDYLDLAAQTVFAICLLPLQLLAPQQFALLLLLSFALLQIFPT